MKSSMCTKLANQVVFGLAEEKSCPIAIPQMEKKNYPSGFLLCLSSIGLSVLLICFVLAFYHNLEVV